MERRGDARARRARGSERRTRVLSTVIAVALAAGSFALASSWTAEIDGDLAGRSSDPTPAPAPAPARSGVAHGSGAALPEAGRSAAMAGTAAAATIPEVGMVCAPRQTDVNHADAGAIAGAFGLSRPVADRVVTSRPYLRPHDLVVVPGVGEPKAAAIASSGRACATPPSIPPPSAEACKDDRPDLQSATVNELVDRLRLSRPVAERLVSARPFASISHVTPERVAGLGRGRNEELRSVACLTPAPVRTETASFRWAYASQKTTITRHLAALETRRDVLDVPGAWLSITDSASPTPMNGPTSDFHIWGPWADGTDTVGVTMPIDPDLSDVAGSELAPVLIHEVPGDLELFGGPSTTVNASTVSAQLSSLSNVTSYLLPLRYFTVPDPAGLRASTLLEELARGFTGTRADQPSCAQSLDPARADTTGSFIDRDVLLGRVPTRWCAGIAGANARWTFANDTGTVLSFNAQHVAHVVDTGPSGDALTDIAFEVLNGTHGPPEQTARARVDIPPGGSVSIDVKPGTVDDEVLVASNEYLALNAFLLRSIGQFIPSSKAADVWAVLNDCGWAQIASGQSLFTTLNCARDLLLAGGNEAFKKAVEFTLTIISGGVTFEDALLVDLSAPYDVLLTWLSVPSTVPPGQGSDGSISGGSGGSSSRAGRMILKRRNSVESFVLREDGTARPIPDGGTYLCNAFVMPVRYGVDDAEFAAAAPGGVSGSATCSDEPARSLSPASTRNHILRLASGEAWLVDTVGNRTRILGGTEGFDCFAERFLVWDFVTQDELRRFPIQPGDVGTFCGG